MLRLKRSLSLSLSLISLIFSVLVLTGCGGGGGGESNSGSRSGDGGDDGSGDTGGGGSKEPSTFSVSFYDENVSLLAVFNNLEGSIVDVEGNKTLIAGGKWYLENGGGEAEAAYTITDSNLRFYASDGIKTVTTQAELAAIYTNATTLSGKYILLKDIELADDGAGFDADGWIPIGRYGNKFSGIFNGNNHKITNLWINRPSTDFVGLFGFSENNVQIKNLGVEIAEGRQVEGYYRVGAIAGYVNSGSIINSYSTGTVKAKRYAGGIVGTITYYSTIQNSSSTGNVTADYYAGGIAGGIFLADIRDSYSTGDIRVFNNYAGGITGDMGGNSTVQNSYSTGNIIVVNDYAGGITGEMRGNSTIQNSYSTGNVNGYTDVSGIAGYSSSSVIQNSYSTGNISGHYEVGGIVGYLVDSSVIQNSYSRGTVNGCQGVGGIAAFVVHSSITNSYSTGSVSATCTDAGGIVGYVHNSSVTNNAAINPSVSAMEEYRANRITAYIAYINEDTVSNNFALESMVVSGVLRGSAGISKSETELKQETTYSDDVNGDGFGGLGWKFGNDDNNPWKIDAGKNDGFPYFYWQNDL